MPPPAGSRDGTAETSARTVLFLAQLPPPVHGVTAMSQRVHDVMAGGGRWIISHRWLGGSQDLQDINRRTFAKYLAFGRFLGGLLAQRITGARYDIAYLTLAPLTHAALRDGLLAGAAKGLARRTLVHLHGEGLEQVLAGTSVRDRALRRLLAGTELITATTKAAEAARRAPFFARVTLLPNAVPDPGPPRDAPSASASGRPLRVGYLANLDPRKGVLRFVDTIAAAARTGVPVRAVIAGPSTPFLSHAELRERVAEEGLAEILAVEDARYGADKDAYWRGIDVFVYPSRHDHAPLVVLEALSYGVVPIVLDTGGVAEMLGSGLAHAVAATHDGADAFAKKAAALLGAYATDPGRLAADRHAARDRYLSHFDEPRFARRLITLLDGS